jgi:class 3 adenylate cyclase
VELPQGADPSSAASLEGRPTRGFLFSDLRGYTIFVESHGADAATELLARYRRHVRQAVAHHRGAEIRTEGDGFYIVFPSVSSAVTCGLEILSTAAGDTSGPPLGIGIGIHAGEAVDTSEGFVGSAVNVAARLCAVAGPGEILVSDTVRALTKSVLDVPFVSKGRRTLKGVAEPLLVFAVRSSTQGQKSRASGLLPDRRRVIVAGVVIAIAAALAAIALALGGRAPTSSPLPSLGAAVGGSSFLPSESRPSNAAAPSPTSTVALNGREEQLLTHVPVQFRTGCAPAPGLAGRAQIVCLAPGIGSITYTAYDNVAAMREEYDRRYGSGALQDAHDIGRIQACPEGPYQRSYYQAAGIQSGRVSCLVDLNIPNVVWSDERLAILTVAASQDLQGPSVTLEALHRWWQRREAGPIP